jgi:Fe2+ transport system protein FeoA
MGLHGNMMTLADVEEGRTVRVRRLHADKALKQRMMDMGITPGTEIRVERYAPLYDPIQIRLKGYSLALRVEEGRKIEIDDKSGD